MEDSFCYIFHIINFEGFVQVAGYAQLFRLFLIVRFRGGSDDHYCRINLALPQSLEHLNTIKSEAKRS